jgi:subtilisin family serine protease
MALPVKKGEFFKVVIPNEFIVQTNGEKLLHNVKRTLGKNLFLVKTNSQKSLVGFKSVHPNYEYYGEFKDVSDNTPNDTNFSKQFHHTMIETTKAWSTTKGSKEVIVAVTDNEFQIDHKDLQTTWWSNQNEIPGNGIDDDKNGYIDDVIGWDFIGKDNNVDSESESTHGTHVAGIIAATANNTLGGTGIAPGVKVMPLRWYGSEASWTSAIIAETYHYAVDMGAKIITTSYNIDWLIDDQVYLDAIKYIRDNNVLIFNSAGNGNQKNPPRQKIEDVILVCSVKSKDANSQDKRSSFSNYGTGIDICAPGDPVYSTTQSSSGVQDAYGDLQGTSMAAPAAAAVAALIWSAHPNFTDEEVRERLYDSADEIDSKNFWYKGKLGAGRINALKAVQ